jgi:hypothetical protein
MYKIVHRHTEVAARKRSLLLALVRQLLLLSLRFSIGRCRLSSSLAPLAHKGLMFAAPGLDVAARQGQDHLSIIDGIGVFAAGLAKAAIAEDRELLLLRPALMSVFHSPAAGRGHRALHPWTLRRPYACSYKAVEMDVSKGLFFERMSRVARTGVVASS